MTSVPASPERPCPRLDVVIVTWNNQVTLDRCLASLRASDRRGYAIDRLVVVDNASDPPYQISPDAELPPVHVMTNARNCGFAGACNMGARGSRADYLLFLNPDARVGPTSIAAAIEALEEDRGQTAILGLQMVDNRGELQATCGRSLTLFRVFNQVTGLSSIGTPWFPGIRMTPRDHQTARIADWVSGAGLFVRRDVFDELGGFDERFFLYLEDADLALRARGLGWSARFIVADPIVHASGWETGRHRPWRLAHSWRSLLVYAWKHFRWIEALTATALVMGVAPLARLGLALLHRSGREMLAACVGYAWLWRLLVSSRWAAGFAGLPPAWRTRSGRPADGPAAP